MFSSDKKTATLDYDRAATEFTADDVDRFTDLVDLGDNYEFITVEIPALDASGVVTPYVQWDDLIASDPVPVHALASDATGSYAHATSSGAGGITVIFRIGGMRYLRMYVGADQAANRIFYIRGFNRMAYGT